MVNPVFRKRAAAKSLCVLLAAFTLLLSVQFGLDSLRGLNGGFAHEHRRAELRKPRDSSRAAYEEAGHAFQAFRRPKYVRRSTADVPPPSFFCLALRPSGRVVEDRSGPLFSRQPLLQGPRSPPTIS
jgi:hypothetical protein